MVARASGFPADTIGSLQASTALSRIMFRFTVEIWWVPGLPAASLSIPVLLPLVAVPASAPGCSTPNTPRLRFLHRRHFCLLACAFRVVSILFSLRVPHFPRRRCTNFSPRLPWETISLCWVVSPPVDADGRLALSASASSRINRHHKGTSIHARS